MSHRFNQELHSFAILLSKKELSLNLSNDYCDRYLKHLIHNRNYYLDIYAHVFEKVLTNSNLSKENMTIIDYGAGNGLMGLFAKYCGFGKVIINDLDKSFLQSSQTLAENLSIKIDQFIEGDIVTLQEELVELKPHAIIATDVIEHIYNLNDFFARLNAINPEIVSVFTTGSNPENYFKVKKLRALQIKDEFEGGSPNDFLLFGSEPHKAYFEIRKAIISELLRNEDDNLVKQFASSTRGMQKKDILSAIEEYQKTGNLPREPVDKFNTCQPETGSWTERILSINEYKSIYQSNGFVLSVYAGFYNGHKKGLKKIMFQGINLMVSIFGMRFAPFIILSGKPVKS